MEDERLLDLGVVEQVAVARARAAGDRGARSPRRASVSSSRLASTGQMLMLSRRVSSGERNRPSETRTTKWVEISALRSAAARSSPGGTSAVLWTHARTSAVPSSRGSERTVKRPPRRSPSRARRPRRAELEPLLDASWRSPSASQVRSRGERRPGRARRRTPAARGRRPRALCRVRRRVDDPERRRGRVLGRARRVRVQRVALVQQRGDELIEHRARSDSSSATQASKLGRPPRARRAFRALERLVAEADPAAARVMLGDHRPPGRDRHPELGRGAPRHRRDL